MMEENEIQLGDGLTYAKSYYIMGICDKGPTNEPIKIENITQAHEMFGINDVTRAWHEAHSVMGNEANYYITRINGTPSEFMVFGHRLNQSSNGGLMSEQYKAINLISYHSGEVWDECNITFTEDYIQINNPESIGGSASFYYEDHPTMGQLTEAINESFHAGEIGIMASCYNQFDDVNDIKEMYKDTYYSPLYFSDGEDQIEVTKNELHELLDMTYNILEGRVIDIFSIIGAYFDDINPIDYYGDTNYGKLYYSVDRDYLTNQHQIYPWRSVTFHGQAIDFCKRQMKQGILTHCVMAFNPVESVEEILKVNSYSMKVADASCLNDRFDIVEEGSNGDVIDNGKYISLVLGEFLYQDHNGMSYYNNGFVAYGAYLASNLSASSPTNDIIPHISTIRYNLDDDEIDYMGRLGVVTFRKSILKQAIVVSNGVTAALFDSPFHVVSNVRMVQLILNAYNSVLQAFVGQDVDRLMKTKAIDKTIELITTALISDGVAKNIVPRLTISPVGVALLELDVLCNYSIEYVKATTNIKL